MNRRSALALTALVLFVALMVLTGCASSGGKATTGGGTSGGGTTPAASGTTVTEKNIAFSPTTVNAAVGDTVTFVNEDSMTHDVSVDGKDLGAQAPGEKVTWTAEKTGTFPFKCLIHPSMTGEIVVK
jgi:plastocyanin